MKSIRSFLLRRLLGGTAMVLAGAGIAVVFVVTASLETQFDENLADRVRGFASILFQVQDEVEFEFSQELMPEYEREHLPAFFELRFEDGELLERSESLKGRELVVEREPTAEPSFWTAPLPDGRTGRYVAQWIEIHHVYPEEGPGRPTPKQIRVVVGLGREELLAAQLSVILTCAAVCLVLTVLIAFLSWTTVDRGLEPAKRFAAAVDAIEVHQLPEHLEIGEMPCELRPVAEKTDALVRRVDAALKRERRTTADIAHQLRTPISEILTASEVALRGGKDIEGTRKALATVREVASRMGRTVSTLLKLARLDMGAERFDREPVDLGNLVRELLRSFAALERERELRVENLVAEGDLVLGDRDVLRNVVSNLLSNALYYSPTGGMVECRLERSDGGWRFLVENEAVDLEPGDLRSLAEPFWRKERARSDHNRSGLGLALSCALAEKTGMELVFELQEGTFRAILVSRDGKVGDEPPASADAGGAGGARKDAEAVDLADVSTGPLR